MVATKCPKKHDTVEDASIILNGKELMNPKYKDYQDKINIIAIDPKNGIPTITRSLDSYDKKDFEDEFEDIFEDIPKGFIVVITSQANCKVGDKEFPSFLKNYVKHIYKDAVLAIFCKEDWWCFDQNLPLMISSKYLISRTITIQLKVGKKVYINV